MAISSKVDHQCPVPQKDRDWDRLGATEWTPSGVPLNEIHRCKACGYKFKVARIYKPPRFHNGKIYPFSLAKKV